MTSNYGYSARLVTGRGTNEHYGSPHHNITLLSIKGRLTRYTEVLRSLFFPRTGRDTNMGCSLKKNTHSLWMNGNYRAAHRIHVAASGVRKVFDAKNCDVYILRIACNHQFLPSALSFIVSCLRDEVMLSWAREICICECGGSKKVKRSLKKNRRNLNYPTSLFDSTTCVSAVN